MKSKKPPQATTSRDDDEMLDPNDSDKESDKIKGQTKVHAKPPRLEDEGQSGG